MNRVGSDVLVVIALGRWQKFIIPVITFPGNMITRFVSMVDKYSVNNSIRTFPGIFVQGKLDV